MCACVLSIGIYRGNHLTNEKTRAFCHLTKEEETSVFAGMRT